jgi:hypothetical protein
MFLANINKKVEKRERERRRRVMEMNNNSTQLVMREEI